MSTVIATSGLTELVRLRAKLSRAECAAEAMIAADSGIQIERQLLEYQRGDDTDNAEGGYLVTWTIGRFTTLNDVADALEALAAALRGA